VTFSQEIDVFLKPQRDVMRMQLVSHRAIANDRQAELRRVFDNESDRLQQALLILYGVEPGDMDRADRAASFAPIGTRKFLQIDPVMDRPDLSPRNPFDVGRDERCVGGDRNERGTKHGGQSIREYGTSNLRGVSAVLRIDHFRITQHCGRDRAD
jgi:hypothetical protein